MTSTVAVVGCGPIGAATAYGLAKAGVGDVTLVTGTPDTATYRSSGGSVCWHRNDPEKAAMIRATAEFVRARVAEGARIRVRDQPYLFLDQGLLAPALNIASADLVADLADSAVRDGVRARDLGRVTGIEPVDGGHRVTGERGHAYVFVKHVDGDLRLLLGQEDVVATPSRRPACWRSTAVRPCEPACPSASRPRPGSPPCSADPAHPGWSETVGVG